MRTAVVLAALVAACGCHHKSAVERQAIGTPCARDAECGTSPPYNCATDHPAGYCEAACRGDRDCPAGSVCVGGDPISEGSCHRACDRARPEMCRAAEGYRCIHDGDASHDYCDPPGRSDVARRVRGGAWRW